MNFKTSDEIQGIILAHLPWEGGLKTELLAKRSGVDEDTTRRALEDLLRRGMVTIDDQNYWRKKELIYAARKAPATQPLMQPPELRKAAVRATA